MQTDEEKFVAHLEKEAEKMRRWPEWMKSSNPLGFRSVHLAGSSEHCGDSSEHLEDICLICGGPINLALPHGYDRELDAPVHRNCEAGD